MDHRSAATRVFATPELATLILQEYNQKFYVTPAAHRLAFVTRNWLEPALNEFWKQCSAVSKLRRIPTAQNRRQYYASKIRALSLDGKAAVEDGEILNAELGNLESLSLGSHFPPGLDWADLSTPRKAWILSLLGPKLLHLSVKSYYLLEDEDLLNTIASCKSLDSLSLTLKDGRGESILLRLTEALPQLKHLHLYLGVGYYGTASFLFDNSFLSALTTLPNLQTLTFWSSPNLANTPGHMPDFSDPSYPALSFPNLRSLTGYTLAHLLTPIPNLMPLLTTLELLIEVFEEFDDTTFFSRLTPLHHLQHLSLSFRSTENLTNTELTSLKKFKNLTSLRLSAWADEADDETPPHPYPYMAGRLSASNLTDELFAEILAGLPGLEELVFNVDHNLTTSALVSVGVNCRRLQTLSLPGRFALREVANVGVEPLFPGLLDLSVGGLDLDDRQAAVPWRGDGTAGGEELRSRSAEKRGVPGEGEVREMVSVIERQMPVLGDVHCMDDEDLEGVLALRRKRKRFGMEGATAQEIAEDEKERRPVVGGRDRLDVHLGLGRGPIFRSRD